MINKVTLLALLLFFLFGLNVSAHVTTPVNEPAVINYILPAIIGLIIIFGFGSYWLIFRRKKF
jgi:hypothetical protein